jgi:hypothetical protein
MPRDASSNSSEDDSPVQAVLDTEVELALEKHKGKWVAVLGPLVVAVGDSATEVTEAALAKGVTDPIVFRVPNHPDHLSYY